MFSRKTFVIGSFAIAVLGLAGGALIGDQILHRPTAKSEAAWAEMYQTPKQMASRVDAVVLAKAVSVSPGRVDYSENGEDALPYEVFELEIVNAYKGLRGQRYLSIERAGGESPDGSSVYLDADGGPYEIGQTYLLFLKRQPDGPYYYQVNHQGRYRIASGRLQSVEKGDAVADTLDGRTLSEGLEVIRTGLRQQVPGE